MKEIWLIVLNIVYWAFVIVGIAYLLMWLSPNMKRNPYLGIYKPTDKELAFYDKLKIKEWKGKLPACKWGDGIGATTKNKDATSWHYLELARKMCHAQLYHIIVIILSIVSIFINPLSNWFYSIPIAIIAILIQIPCIMAARYNLPRTIKLFEELKAKSK